MMNNHLRQRPEELSLREAKTEDMALLFEWANNQDVRNHAFHPDPIPWKDHQEWFRTIMADPDQYQYILMLGDNPIGQIRLSCSGCEAEIDYSISPEYRGQGFGMKMLELVKKTVQKDLPEVQKLVGKVKKGNIASENCFMRSDFQLAYSCFEYQITENQNGQVCDSYDEIVEP